MTYMTFKNWQASVALCMDRAERMSQVERGITWPIEGGLKEQDQRFFMTSFPLNSPYANLCSASLATMMRRCLCIGLK